MVNVNGLLNITSHGSFCPIPEQGDRAGVEESMEGQKEYGLTLAHGRFIMNKFCSPCILMV